MDYTECDYQCILPPHPPPSNPIPSPPYPPPPPPFLSLTLPFLFPSHRHSLEFGQGDLDDAVEFRLEQYADSGAALQAVQSVAVPPDGEFQTPPNVVSPYVLVNPVTNFAAAQRTATIVIDIDDSASTDTQIYRANPSSDWNFVSMSTEVQDGRAIAQTDQGGVFVAASGLNTIAIAVGVSVAVVLLVVVLCGSAIMVYFVVRPEKWRKTTDTVRKTKTKVTRSFAKQV